MKKTQIYIPTTKNIIPPKAIAISKKIYKKYVGDKLFYKKEKINNIQISNFPITIIINNDSKGVANKNIINIIRKIYRDKLKLFLIKKIV